MMSPSRRRPSNPMFRNRETLGRRAPEYDSPARDAPEEAGPSNQNQEQLMLSTESPNQEPLQYSDESDRSRSRTPKHGHRTPSRTEDAYDRPDIEDPEPNADPLLVGNIQGVPINSINPLMSAAEKVNYFTKKQAELARVKPAGKNEKKVPKSSVGKLIPKYKKIQKPRQRRMKKSDHSNNDLYSYENVERCHENAKRRRSAVDEAGVQHSMMIEHQPDPVHTEDDAIIECSDVEQEPSFDGNDLVLENEAVDFDRIDEDELSGDGGDEGHGLDLESGTFEQETVSMELERELLKQKTGSLEEETEEQEIEEQEEEEQEAEEQEEEEQEEEEQEAEEQEEEEQEAEEQETESLDLRTSSLEPKTGSFELETGSLEQEAAESLEQEAEEQEAEEQEAEEQEAEEQEAEEQEAEEQEAERAEKKQRKSRARKEQARFVKSTRSNPDRLLQFKEQDRAVLQILKKYNPEAFSSYADDMKKLDVYADQDAKRGLKRKVKK